MHIENEILEMLNASNNVYDFVCDIVDFLYSDFKTYGWHTYSRFTSLVKDLLSFKIFEKFLDEAVSIFSTEKETFSRKRLEFIELIRNLPESAFTCTAKMSENTIKALKDCRTIWVPLYLAVTTVDLTHTFQWETEKTFGPVDINSKHRFRLYVRPSMTFLTSYEKGLKKERTGRDCLFKNLTSFVLFDSKKWEIDHNGAGIPQGRIVKNRNMKDKRIRIALGSFCKEQNFDDPFEAGSNLLSIQYFEETKQKHFADRARKALMEAIKYECDIFVLPEYCSSEAVLTEIENTLYEVSSKGFHTPDLTFAGSTWTDDDNNVMSVLTNTGMTIGQYYKFAPYVDKNGVRSENLRNPGMVSTLFCIENVGLVLPAICRDVIDNNCTRDLVKLFTPLLVVIPAYSTSVNSFKTPMEEMAKEYYSNSVMIDYCACRTDDDDIGLCYVVRKDKTVSGCSNKVVQRKSNCSISCDDCCLFVYEYDFEHFTKASDGSDKYYCDPQLHMVTK